MAQAVLGKTRKSQAQKSNTDGKTCAWPTSPFHARVEGKGRKGWSLPGGTLLVCVYLLVDSSKEVFLDLSAGWKHVATCSNIVRNV